jgi:hypothetical protein
MKHFLNTFQCSIHSASKPKTGLMGQPFGREFRRRSKPADLPRINKMSVSPEGPHTLRLLPGSLVGPLTLKKSR